MLNAPPAWQLYAQDFLTDVQEWDDAAVGVYIRLLNYQWINRSIPSTIKSLKTLCNTDEETLSYYWENFIKHKFKQKTEDGRLQNKRLEEYWMHLKSNRKKNSLAGKESAAKRKREKERNRS